MNTYKIIFTREDGTQGTDHFAAINERQARKDFGECISFNADGWIGFAGWADQGNTNPILRAFIEWCDALAATKEKEDTQQ